MTRCLMFTLLFLVSSLISTVGLPVEPPAELLQLGGGDVGGGRLSVDASDIAEASRDFGGVARAEPMAVFHPRAAGDVAGLVGAAFRSARGFRVSARGHGHSISGQAQAAGGVVVDMSRGRGPGAAVARALPVHSAALGGHYVDVWGGELWVDVLNWTLSHGGLAPRSWTDYLYLSVGGTLSNAGISGQAFHHGPQISNVYELDVVTGKGEVVTCSETENPDLFFGVLGGLGQFGIITRARIALERAPKRVRWIRALYSNFSEFTADQERLISLGSGGGRRFDYVEGFVVAAEGLINNWRSSFFSPQNPVKLTSLKHHSSVLYCLEVTKNYDDETAGSVDQDVDTLLGELNFLPGTVFTTDLPYVDFLDRVHKAELKLRAKGMWEVPHPWLNLFVPASRIADFDRGVFRGVLGGRTAGAGGPVLIYPMNKHKWDPRSSAVTPDEEVFYLVAFLRSALPGAPESLEALARQNQRILDFCAGAGIGAKQYLPGHKARHEWAEHFGAARWDRFARLKAEFDPRAILAAGQGIFRPPGSPALAADS
ncbi:Cytokinin dehydrogenase 5 precursor [Zea mays]|uniref:cytokinin dehydrogenase n=1 Tax=Zea mays TaxID=4577 RepID=A0A1D6NA77_MAIZE|nr:Cytokinin dehydrogenase 5 precursor [Zea mays]ONM37449.1 cytokinin oxidase 4 [Zea mays]|eukprot:XP_008672378.1 cytokinin dehydrogenase 4 isoform X1 [Zea mays]